MGRNSVSVRALTIVAAGSAVLLGVRIAQGTVLYVPDESAEFGNVAQNIGGDINNSTVACGPTSVYNSFVFLKNTTGVDLTGTSAAATINQLEVDMTHPGNTSFNGVVDDVDLVNGKQTYINSLNLNGTVVVESLISDPNAVPAAQAAQFIYNQLMRGQHVEIGFFWSDQNGVATQGGHWGDGHGHRFRHGYEHRLAEYRGSVGGHRRSDRAGPACGTDGE